MQVLAATLGTSSSVHKTFEVRRKEGRKDLDALLGETDVARALLRLAADWDRTSVGLPPFPAESEVPPPLTKVRPA